MGRSQYAPSARSGLHQTLAALAYAVEQHAAQRRTADGAPFILHPIEVATLLADVGAPDDVVAAGVLHDTIEKTSTEPADLDERFGPRVAALVVVLSEDPSISGYGARKAALREQVSQAGDEALMVFAADKLSKARELSLSGRAPQHPGAPPFLRRGSKAYRKLTHYRHCAEMLEERLPGSPLVRSLRDELTQLAQLEPARELVGAP